RESGDCMKFYKAVRIVNDKYYSWATSRGFNLTYEQEKKFKLEYELDKWTVPNLGKLFVFSDLYSAIDLDSHYNYCEKAIFECEILGEPDHKDQIPYIRTIEDFWNNVKLTYMDLFTTPANTLLVDAIKPTKL